MLKPGIIQRKMAGEIISRFEKKGLKIVACKMLKMTEELAKRQYAEHKGKEFYEPLMRFMVSSPILAMVIEGPNVIQVVRKLVGTTNPEEALPGTIRGDYALSTRKNIMHASDSPASAQREIQIFFKDNEIINYNLDQDRWLLVT